MKGVTTSRNWGTTSKENEESEFQDKWGKSATVLEEREDRGQLLPSDSNQKKESYSFREKNKESQRQEPEERAMKERKRERQCQIQLKMLELRAERRQKEQSSTNFNPKAKIPDLIKFIDVID